MPLIVLQYLTQGIRRERLKFDGAVITSEQRLSLILEYLLHHPEDAARYNQTNIRLFLITVPQLLNVAEHTGIHVIKLLKLVYEQRKPPTLADLQVLPTSISSWNKSRKDATPSGTNTPSLFLTSAQNVLTSAVSVFRPTKKYNPVASSLVSSIRR